MEIHSVRIEHGPVQTPTMSYPQRQPQSHRPNHSQPATDLYKPSRSPLPPQASVAATSSRYPYPASPQQPPPPPPPSSSQQSSLNQVQVSMAQRYPPSATPNTTTVFTGGGGGGNGGNSGTNIVNTPTGYRDYRPNRISLLHSEYGTSSRRDIPPPQSGGGMPAGIVHIDTLSPQHQQQQQGGNGQQPIKKIRLQDHKDHIQPLRIDTRPGMYNPQVEAISPTLPDHLQQEDQVFRTTKDELIQQIGKVDREIAKAESQIAILKKKQQELEEIANKQPSIKSEIVDNDQQQLSKRHQSLPQQIYAENRKKAAQAHAKLDNLGAKIEWPLYNQPSDTQIYHENKRKHLAFKKRLLEYFKRRHLEKEQRNTYLTETYSKLMQEWLRKVDKIESSSKRRAKEAKNREFFEKVFPELRKQREDKERFNRVGARVKSEADMEEIMDNLQEQAMEDKKMRSYAVIPPILLDIKERKVNYQNDNGYIDDMEEVYKRRQFLNIWTPSEKELFKEKYLQHPKNFGVIASFIERKSVADCVQYYYLSKKTENYKQLLRKSRQRTRSSRNNTQKVNSSATTSVVDILTTGVTTRLQREQQQKTVAVQNREQQAAMTTTTETTTTTSVPASSTTATTAALAPSSGATTQTATVLTTTSNSVISNNNSNNNNNNNNNNNSSSSSNNNNNNNNSNNSNNTLVASITASATTNNQGGVNNQPLSPKPGDNAHEHSNNNNNNNNNNNRNFNDYNNLIIDNEQQKTTVTVAVATTTTTSPTIITTTVAATTMTTSATTTTTTTATTITTNQKFFGDDAKGDGSVMTAADSAHDGVANLHNLQIKKEIEPSALDNISSNEQNTIVETKKKKERRKDNTLESSDDETIDLQEKSVQGSCIVCNAQLGPHLHSRPLVPSQAQQYGLREDQIPTNGRVCNTCRCKCVRSRYTHCPLQTCPNSRGRIKRLRTLPQRLYELPMEIREQLFQEFHITTNITKCCSACFNRIQRRLQPLDEWHDDEIQQLRQLLNEYGGNWQLLGERLNKTKQQVSNFYYSNWKRLNFEFVMGDDLKPSLTDEEESGSTTSSCDEQTPTTTIMRTNSNQTNSPTTNNVVVVVGGGSGGSSGGGGGGGGGGNGSASASSSNSGDRHSSDTASAAESPPVIINPNQTIIKKEDYDSSATETADEAQTPDHYQNNHQTNNITGGATITPIINTSTTTPSIISDSTSSSLQQSRQNSSPLSVKDLVLNVIEFSLMKNPNGGQIQQQQQQPTASSISMAPTISSILNNDSNEVTIVSEYNLNTPPQRLLQTQQQTVGQRSNDLSLAKLVTPLIGATITPVPPPPPQHHHHHHLQQQQQQPQQQHHQQPHHHHHQHQHHHHHHQMENPARNDDLVVLSVQSGGGGGGNLEPETLDLSIKKPREPPPAHCSKPPQYVNYHPQQQQQQQQERKSPAYSAIRHQQSKLPSPKLTANPKSGSITLGTPIINQPRYDGGLLRQIPNSIGGNSGLTVIPQQQLSGQQQETKLGSITQGTPMHISHLQSDKRFYDYFNKRNSPNIVNQTNNYQSAQQQQQQQQQQYRQPYGVEQQLTSRQIIMNDYITSQQMMSRRNDKSGYYPANSPHRTPPPPPPQQQQQQQQVVQPPPQQQQRQGVIQRHTPRPQYLQPGHEALSSLVDVAVQQPSLPVPNQTPHEGLGKTMVDNIMEQPQRLHIIQQQQLRQQQQRIEEQRRVYHHHHQQQQQQQHQQQQQQHQQRSRSSGDSSTLTAASLIDAIITHQINQTAEGGRGSEIVANSREPPRAGDLLFQSFHRDPPPPPPPPPQPQQQQQEVVEQRPPSVISIDLDSDTINKSLTVKELTDSVISHDFSTRTHYNYHLQQQQQQQQQESVDWKRRLVAQQQQQQQQKEEAKRASTPQQDERQIIRIAQTQKYHVEPVSPPDNHWTNESNYRRYPPVSQQQQQQQQQQVVPTVQQQQQQQQQQPQSQHISALDYVKNRIVEVMRTEDDKKETPEIISTTTTTTATAATTTTTTPSTTTTTSDKERNSDSPGEMVIDEDKVTNSIAATTITATPTTTTTTIVATTTTTTTITPEESSSNQYGYTYVHKDSASVSASGSGSGGAGNNNEPKPLLSAQYEPLSDED